MMRSPPVRIFLFITLMTLSLINAYMVHDRIRSKTRQTLKGGLKLEANLLAEPKSTTKNSVGKRLILSPFIARGEIEEAQKRAVVPPMVEGIDGFSGYITVDDKCQSNMFFWLFKSITGDWLNQPLIIWLQGGPGVSSLFGCFREIGPIVVEKDGQPKKREYPWNQKYNLLFIDSPVGTGFSYTGRASGYAKTQDDVANDLYEFMTQFYKLFPALLKVRLYIMGESYAGKYIPTFSNYIYKKNEENKGNGGLVIPLAAVGIGNGLTDTYNMMVYGDYMYQIGLVDRNGRTQLHKYEDQMRELISSGQFAKAERVWNEGVFGTIYNLTAINSLYNYVNDMVELEGPEVKFFNLPETRRAIHVGNQKFELSSDTVYENLVNDVMKPIKPTFEAILEAEAFDVVTFNGQLDIICAYPLSVNVYHNLQWKGAAEYAKIRRCGYVLDDQAVGYYKHVNRFTEIMFRGCGHMVPSDNPKVANDFLDRFIANISSFNTCDYECVSN